jgi:Fe2+ transport system protein FeoA
VAAEQAGDVRAKRVTVDTRVLITAKGALWSEPWADRSEDITGAIVRVQPPTDAQEHAIEELRRRLLEMGAAAVRVLPVRRAAVITAETKLQAKRARTSARAEASKLVEEANTSDRDALARVVEASLVAAGI